MAQAIVDPAELRRFASHLKQFNNNLRDQLTSLGGQLTGLGDSWRDQEHEKFLREFEETMHVLNHFLEVSEEHMPLLVRKAEKVEEYLRR
ncbi:MAG: WXG100 family type VII secretion target [Planctomycetota bacterium]